MKICIVCRAKTVPNATETFHRFPSNAILAQQWAKAIGRENLTVGKWSYVCSKHFEAKCFEDRYSIKCPGKIIKVLLANSVPTLFLKNEIHSSVPSTSSDSSYEPQQKKIQCDASTSTFNKENKVLCDIEESNLSTEYRCEENCLSTTSTRMAQSVSPSMDCSVNTCKSDHKYASSSQTLKRKVTLPKLLVNARKATKLYKLQRNYPRKKVNSLSEIIRVLENKFCLDENAIYCLEALSDAPLHVFNRVVRNSKYGTISRDEYPPELRAFALTVYFYSPKAYAYVRNTFMLALPRSSVLRTWYSSTDAEPGFLEECFTTLRKTVEDAKTRNEQIVCALMMDEMRIQKGCQRGTDGKERGYIDLGVGLIENDRVPEATDALVFMVVGMRGTWKLPIAYFLTRNLSSDVMQNIVNECLIRLEQVGVTICSLTLGGQFQHLLLVQQLGANMSVGTSFCSTTFPHPSSQETNVAVFLDPCHMLQNIQIYFQQYKCMVDNEGEKIEWRYVAALGELQKKGLQLGDKLQDQGVRFKENIVKVFLTGETLSRSVSDAIEFCDEVLDLPQFKDSKATVRFIRSIDNIFNFLNVRHLRGRGVYRGPMDKENEHIWRPLIIQEIEYLKSIKTASNEPIIRSRRRTGFAGLYTDVLSALFIFDEYVKTTGSLETVLTYKMNLDHLDMFFNAIRSRSGWRLYPTATQLVSNFKGLLVRREVAVSNGDTPRDETSISRVSSICQTTAKLDRYDPDVYDQSVNAEIERKCVFNEEDDRKVDDTREYLRFSWVFDGRLNKVSQCIVGFVAGFVVKKLRRIIKCEECLHGCFSIYDENASPHVLRQQRLSSIAVKSNGVLLLPSQCVIEVCLCAEKLYRQSIVRNMGKVFVERDFLRLLRHSAFEQVLTKNPNIFPLQREHFSDTASDGLLSHLYYIVKQILCVYTEYRMYSLTEWQSIQMTRTNVRRLLTRKIVWARH